MKTILVILIAMKLNSKSIYRKLRSFGSIFDIVVASFIGRENGFDHFYAFLWKI